MTIEEQLRAIVRAEARAAVADAIADLGQREAAPALLDRAGLGRALDLSLSTIDKLRREGMPAIRIGDVDRFRLESAISWLEAREHPTRTPHGQCAAKCGKCTVCRPAAGSPLEGA